MLGDRIYAKNGCISPSPAGRLVIPDKIGGAPVCEILGEAFAGCSNVTEIVIPASVEKIDDYCHPLLFVPCRSLERISVSPENRNYCSVDGLLFEREYMSLLAYPQRSRAAIPPHTDGISSRAFARNENIERADIPPAVRYIDSYAFDGCRRLREVSFPSNLPQLSSDGVFGGCDGLCVVKVPRGATCGESFESEEVFRGSSFLKQERTWTDPSTGLLWTYLPYGDFVSVVRVECPKDAACPARVVVPEALGDLPVCWIEMCALAALEKVSAESFRHRWFPFPKMPQASRLRKSSSMFGMKIIGLRTACCWTRLGGSCCSFHRNAHSQFPKACAKSTAGSLAAGAGKAFRR